MQDQEKQQILAGWQRLRHHSDTQKIIELLAKMGYDVKRPTLQYYLRTGIMPEYVFETAKAFYAKKAEVVAAQIAEFRKNFPEDI